MHRSLPGYNPACIGVYAGAGSSHSWIWLAELFERFGWYNVRFLDREDFQSAKPSCGFKSTGLSKLSLVIFSGGAPLGMAEALGRDGALNLERFIRSGRSYIGICAGACLPLYSSMHPLSLFNWVHAPIGNLDEHPPDPVRMSWKYRTPYGDRFVFHPVREEVLLEFRSKESNAERIQVSAPLYGGPPLMPEPDGPVRELACFSGFTKRTLHLADPSVGRRVVLNKAAAVQAEMGQGKLLLVSPHLEHPHYGGANALFRRSILEYAGNGTLQDREQKELIQMDLSALIREVRRAVSNARIRAMGLVPLAIRWPIGQKVYEPEKALAFLEAIWPRLNALRNNTLWPEDAEQRLEVILQNARAGEGLIKDLAFKAQSQENTTVLAGETFDVLRALSADFMNLFFEINQSIR